MVITGILIGSLWVIWPFQQRSYVEVRGKQRLLESTPVLPEAVDVTILGSVLLVLSGFVLVLAMDRFAGNRAHTKPNY
jgi:putative membrane protein